MSNDSPKYRVHRAGPRCWYVMDTHRNELGPTLPTRKLAVTQCAKHNAVHEIRKTHPQWTPSQVELELARLQREGRV